MKQIGTLSFNISTTSILGNACREEGEGQLIVIQNFDHDTEEDTNIGYIHVTMFDCMEDANESNGDLFRVATNGGFEYGDINEQLDKAITKQIQERMEKKGLNYPTIEHQSMGGKVLAINEIAVLPEHRMQGVEQNCMEYLLHYYANSCEYIVDGFDTVMFEPNKLYYQDHFPQFKNVDFKTNKGTEEEYINYQNSIHEHAGMYKYTPEKNAESDYTHLYLYNTEFQINGKEIEEFTPSSYFPTEDGGFIKV